MIVGDRLDLVLKIVKSVNMFFLYISRLKNIYLSKIYQNCIKRTFLNIVGFWHGISLGVVGKALNRTPLGLCFFDFRR